MTGPTEAITAAITEALKPAEPRSDGVFYIRDAAEAAKWIAELVVGVLTTNGWALVPVEALEAMRQRHRRYYSDGDRSGYEYHYCGGCDAGSRTNNWPCETRKELDTLLAAAVSPTPPEHEIVMRRACMTEGWTAGCRCGWKGTDGSAAEWHVAGLCSTCGQRDNVLCSNAYHLAVSPTQEPG